MTTDASRILELITGRLIVSCQAGDGHALRDTATMARMARAAVDGGAAAIRCGGVGGVPDVAAIVSDVAVPVVGLTKRGTEGVYITPTARDAVAVARAGADVVAVDATDRPRPDGAAFSDTVRAVHDTGRLVMADVATLAEGVAARDTGADMVATTLSGNVGAGPAPDGPDIALVAQLRAALPDTPIVAEGRYHRPDQVRSALVEGATAVVVGTAITDPTWITAMFAEGASW